MSGVKGAMKDSKGKTRKALAKMKDSKKLKGRHLKTRIL